MPWREVVEPARSGEWVACVAEVVVPQHGVRTRPEAQQELAELLLAARVSEQVARQEDELGLTFLHPGHSALDRSRAAGRHTEMEVREMGDAQAVELGRKPRNLHLERPEPHPTGLEPAPAEQPRGGGAQAADDAREHPENLRDGSGPTKARPETAPPKS